jgi:hypothetical protein
MVSVSLRNDDVIDGFNSNDLSGNTGWTYIGGDMPDEVSDENGVPLWKLENGVIVARTQSERDAETANTFEAAPMEAIEAKIDYIAMMVGVDLPESEV